VWPSCNLAQLGSACAGLFRRVLSWRDLEILDVLPDVGSDRRDALPPHLPRTQKGSRHPLAYIFSLTPCRHLSPLQDALSRCLPHQNIQQLLGLNPRSGVASDRERDQTAPGQPTGSKRQQTVEGAGSMCQTGCCPPPFPRSRPSMGPQSSSPAMPARAALRARSRGGRTDSHHRTSRLDIALRLTGG
jgi:hypothetical protein